MMSMNVKVVQEAFSKDKEFYDAVRRFETLQLLAYSDKSGDSYNACVKVGNELQILIRRLLNITNNHIVVCRTYNDMVWMLELDYFDDGADLYLLTEWPDMTDLEDAGLTSLNGEILNIAWFSDMIQEQYDVANGSEFTEEIDGLIDFIHQLEIEKQNTRLLKEA